MEIEGILWLRHVVDKLAWKHHVTAAEVEEMLSARPKIRCIGESDREGESVYLALGRTDAGRYLSAIFIHKHGNEALILSARDMAKKERTLYGQK